MGSNDAASANGQHWQRDIARLKALAAGKDDRAEKAFERFQELIDLTIRYGRSNNPKTRPALLEELCRLREFYCLAFTNKNLPDLLAFNRYFDRFAFVKG